MLSFGFLDKKKIKNYLASQLKIRIKILIPGLLVLIFALALFLRIYYPYGEVFQEPIRYAADDGVYHMRLVENMLLGHHFPKRIYFDPYTYFPHGTYIHFGPLYDQLIAGFVLIFSGFKPTLEVINSIAPFFPAVLGSLTIFLLYLLGKKLWSKWAGVLAAFFMAVSQPFVFRSLLGATDHHQAEVFFSTLTILFLVYLVDFIKQKGTDLKKLVKEKRFWLYNFLLGFSTGLYFLVWNGAIMFLFIFFIFFAGYYIWQYVFWRKREDWVFISGFSVFLIPFLMVCRHFFHPNIYWAAIYDIRHFGVFVFGALGFLGVWGLVWSFEKLRINRYLFPFVLGILALVFLAILKLILPAFYYGFLSLAQGTKIGMVRNAFARQVIGEMSPLGAATAFNIFFYLFYIFLLALAVIVYKFIKKRDPNNLFIIIWSLVILLMTGLIVPATGQNRFVYYLAVNVSLLSAFLVWAGLKTALYSLRLAERIKEASFSLRIGSSLILFILILSVFYPFPLNLWGNPKQLPQIIQSAVSTAESGAIGQRADWYETLKWIRENTPDVGIDYYKYYEEPKFNKELKRIDPYPYPKTAYGIMASWDAGHMITYYAHRIPNANPFQQGVSEPGKPGEVDFFLSLNEKRAGAILDLLGTRYVITDDGSCNARRGFRGKAVWADKVNDFYFTSGPKKNKVKPLYDQTMCARLYYLDGREFEEDKTRTIPLKHFRLVYESGTKVRKARFKEDKNGEIRMVKIFEYVKGAKIKGRAPTGTEIMISTDIKTNQNRKFTYSQKTIAENGVFEFIVPYSTEGEKNWVEGGTKFAVFAKPYKIKIGKWKEKEINVPERAVVEGREIQAN